MRGLISPKGEQFGYLIGYTLYTMDDEPSGRMSGIYNYQGIGAFSSVGKGILESLNTRRKASFTAWSVGNAAATSGSSSTTFVPAS